MGQSYFFSLPVFIWSSALSFTADLSLTKYYQLMFHMTDDIFHFEFRLYVELDYACGLYIYVHGCVK